MKRLPIICLLLWVGCTSHIEPKKGNDFPEFIGKIKRLKLPLTLCDTNDLNEDKWGKEFDTNDVKKYHLVSAFSDTSNNHFPCKNVKENKCAPIGYFTNNRKIFLLYKTITSEAGSGNPVIVLVIFNSEATILNSITLLSAFLRTDSFYPYKGPLTNSTIITDSAHFSTREMTPSWSSDTEKNGIHELSELTELRIDYQITVQWHCKSINSRDTILFENKGLTK